MIIHRFLTAILITSASLKCLSADTLDWGKLEATLLSSEHLFDDTESLLMVVEKHYTGVTSNENMLVEMGVQSTYPAVAIAGFYGLSKMNVEHAYRVSIGRLWTTPKLASYLNGPFLIYLTNRITQKSFDNTFTAVALIEPKNIENAVIIIQQIPIEHLAKWLLTADRDPSSMTVEAIVIDRLMNSSAELTSDQMIGLQKKLKTLMNCPGVPKAIYLLHTDGSPLPLSPSIVALLEDVAVDTTLKHMLIRKYAQKLIGTLDVEKVKLPEKEKERLKNWLSKYSQ